MNREILVGLCEDGLSLRQIARSQNCSVTNIRYWLRKFGLHVKRGGRGKLPKDMLMIRRCKCGEIDPNKFYGNKRQVCGACHNRYVTLRSKEQAGRMRKLLGGVCVLCGYGKYLTALDIHHGNPEKKDVSFKSIRKWNWERAVEELKECVLLCRCCHGAYHSGEMVEEEREIIERAVAKTGIALASGARDRGFKSHSPDQVSNHGEYQ